MDWFLHSVGHRQPPSHQHSQSAAVTPAQPMPVPVPQLHGDPTFLYGGYGYRPPSFGYAWTGAQTTSFAQLPTDTSSSKALSPKALSKSVSAPDLQNPAAMQDLQSKAQQQHQKHHEKIQGTPPGLPRHNRHLTAPPGTPGESAANTPCSSRASTPPRPRRGPIRDDSFYIGMAAA